MVCRGVHIEACHDLVPMKLVCPVVTAFGKVAVADTLPIGGVDFLLGADLAGKRVFPPPVVVSETAVAPSKSEESDKARLEAEIYPVCAVTRSMAQVAHRDGRGELGEAGTDCPQDGSPDVMRPTTGSNVENEKPDHVDGDRDAAGKDNCPTASPLPRGDLASVGPSELSTSQQDDPSLASSFAKVGVGSSADSQEIFVMKGRVLYRQWIPRGEDAGELAAERLQLVVPVGYRQALIQLAHEAPLAGHMGVRKTADRLRYNFWWPNMRASVAEYIQRCHVCQMVGNPNQPIQVAPLLPIPAVEPPFTRVIIDMVGPLPVTSSGKRFLLTILDVTTRYLEAVPVSSLRAKPVMTQLLNFFSRYGFPREVQSDQGVNFTSKLFKTTFKELGVVQVLSSAYHPQSQGALERQHQTMKSILRKFCFQHEKDWDVGIPFVLFAIREVPSESLGFSPNELVFGHRVRGPLDVVHEVWSGQIRDEEPLLDFVVKTRTRLHQALELAKENLLAAQDKMKTHYDRKSVRREFDVGDEVLALLPVQGNPLAARFSGPYRVTKKVGALDYYVETPDRRKTHQLCHVNMLKPYYRALTDDAPSVAEISQGTEQLLVQNPGAPAPVLMVQSEGDQEDYYSETIPADLWKNNSYRTLTEKLGHLPEERREELCSRLWHYENVFRDSPGRTTWATHDIDIGDHIPVKLPPYRINPLKQEALETELKYMLDRGLIKKGYSEWSSPVTLQPKPDGKVRFCIDFRKVNTLSRTDTYPIPRVDDSVDKIGEATYITKIDLVKGYWQVPLTDRAKRVASFVVSGAVYQCQVMPYGLKNAPATFQRLMDQVVEGVPNCTVYIDDVIIYDTNWEDHVEHVVHLVRRLSEADLVVNLAKCDFVRAEVQYLGFVVGHGKVRPPRAKVEAIQSFSPPQSRKAIQRFLGMIGYYRRFIKDYSTVLAPLTDLLRKDKKFHWSEECSQAFADVKTLLSNHPILRAPDFTRPFILACDASDVGAGAVLMQRQDNGIEHPVSYFSKKFDKAQRNYSVVEKELLALILALQHFAVYLPSYGPEITVYSDHHPLQFLAKFKNKNQRLTRWGLMLQEYNLDVRHIRGVDNVLADCLSREGMET